LEYSAFNSFADARFDKNAKQKIKSNRLTVQALSFDEYVKTNDVKPNFVKIDAESAEYEILCGMKDTIKKYRPIITLEVGDFGINGVRGSNESVEFLKKMDYEAFEYRNHRIVKHDLKEEYSYDNILFLPNEACAAK